MAEPFKNLINAELVAATAHHIRRHWKAFDADHFVALANHGLQGLEMKARAMHIADALQATLPADFHRAADVVEASLAPALPGEDLSLLRTSDQGLAGWVVWPLGEWVVRAGMAHPERSLAALHALTQRLSAEFAIRPFIVAHPDLVFATLARWCLDPSPHVRRLASEGSRPRLPWGLQLKALVADPSPSLPLLRALQDDASAYVRRSVANHLNDIAKDHPGLLAEWLAEHLPRASAERRALLRHASRTLIKRGHPQVLAHWGVGTPFKGEARLRIAPRRVALGEAVRLDISLSSGARTAQTLVVDYAVHHVKADGGASPKVFKGWQLSVDSGAEVALTKHHAMRLITTRRYHSGRHVVDLLVNGRVVASSAFALSVPAR